MSERILVPKSMRSPSERAAEWFLREKLACVITRRCLRTQFNKVDFFAADVVGKVADGSHIYAQVTCGQAGRVSDRRRKLEKIPWHPTDHVMILQVIPTEGKRDSFYTPYDYEAHTYVVIDGERQWLNHQGKTRICRHWLKCYKDKDRGEEEG